MSVSEELILSYLNTAIIESEYEDVKDYGLDLCLIKFDIKEDDSKKFKNILKFVYKYLNFMTITLENKYSFIAYARNTKIHSTVLMMKNLNLALKLKYNTSIKNIAITNIDKNEDLISVLERLQTYYLKAKITHKEIYYGTKYLDFEEKNNNTISTIVKENPNISIFGVYKDTSIKIDSEIIDYTTDSTTIRVAKEYLSFLKKQPILYLEHSNIPDVISTNIATVNFDKSTLETSKFNFIDQSPLHRRNLRVEPPIPIRASLIIDDFMVDGLINDISITSMLFTTQLQFVEELEKQNLINKTFRIQFKIENLHDNNFDIEMQASIFKTMGNQLVLNTYANSETQNIIKEYINMCYQHLLLQVQGKVV